METAKRNVTIQLPRALDATERLKFGARPTFGKCKYIVPNANLDELLQYLNADAPRGCKPSEGEKHEEPKPQNGEGNDNNPNESEQEPQHKECGGDGQPQANAENEQKESGNNESEQPQEQPQEQNEQEQKQEPQEQEQKKIKHRKFNDVLNILKSGEAVYLYGQAGTGKNHLCEEIAKELGVPFYFTNCVQDEFQLKGFVDAKGEFQKTQLYQAFTQGGLFFLDEMDASVAMALIVLNALLANRYMDFPGHTERVYAHPDFYVIAAGNTIGKGQDEIYTGRVQLDGASLDRFTIVNIDYDERVELEIAEGDNDLVQFCRKLRDVCKEMQYNIVVSYRTITRIKKYTKIFDMDNAIRYGFTNAISEDDAIALSGAFANAKDKYGRTFYNLFKV